MSEGALEIVRDLIRITPHPCLLDIQNDLLQSALHLAVLVSHVRLVRMLLLAGAEVSAILLIKKGKNFSSFVLLCDVMAGDCTVGTCGEYTVTLI